MDYSIVRLGRDYPGKITDFSEARNMFLDRLADGKYILFLDDDVEAPKMLLDYLHMLQAEYDWYYVRQLNLRNGKYHPVENPAFTGILSNNRARYRGKVHEKLYPRKPHGRIEIPVIHNHVGPDRYLQPHPYGLHLKLAALKLREILKYGW